MSVAAIVARKTYDGLEYLACSRGALGWAAAEHDADRFATIHEATKVAMRLPSKLRAFALPVCCEVSSWSDSDSWSYPGTPVRAA